MATLKNLGDELKRIFSGVNNAMPYSWAQNPQVQQKIINPIATGIKNTAQSYVNAVPSALRLSPPGQAITYANNLRNNVSGIQNAKNQIGDVAKAAPLVFGAGGLANMGRMGLVNALKTVLPNAAIGGGFSAMSGGNFWEGVGQGIASSPQIAGVTKLTNPLITNTVGKYTRGITNPITKTLASRGATGLLNIPEGAVINSALGRPGYTPTDALIDFGTGALFGTGGGQSANTKGLFENKMTGKIMRRVTDLVHGHDTLMKEPYSIEQSGKLSELEKGLRNLAAEVFDKNFAKNGKIEDIKQELFNMMQVDSKNGIKMGIYGGEKARNFPKDYRGTFSAMADKKTRFEIDDSKGKLLTEGASKFAKTNSSTVGELINHDELFKNYPEVKNISVYYDPEINGAKFSSFSGTGQNVPIIRIGKGVKDIKSTLLHEIDHAIQEKENFARGGSPTGMMDAGITYRSPEKIKELQSGIDWYFSTKEGKQIESLMDEWLNKTPAPTTQQFNSFEQYLRDTFPNYKTTSDAQKQIGILNTAPKNAHEAYQRLFGEISARDVQARMNLTPEQRASTLPFQSQGIPVKDQIVRFDSGTQANKNVKTVTAFHGGSGTRPLETYDVAGGIQKGKQRASSQQEGPGIYFTSQKGDASGYGKVSSVDIDISKFITDKTKITRKQVEDIVKESPELELALSNWDENPQVALKKLVDSIIEYNDKPKDLVQSIAAEAYRNSDNEFVNVMAKNGFDGLIVPREGGVTHYVLYNKQSVQTPNVMLSTLPQQSKVAQSGVGGKAPVPMQNQQIPKPGIEPVKPVKLVQVSDQRKGLQKPLGQESQMPQLKVDQPTVQKGSSASIIPQPVKVEPQQLNVNNLNLDTAQKQEILSMQANQLKTKLGDKQVMDLASNLGIDTKSHTVDQTAKKIAEQLNLRRNVVTLEGELTTMRQSGASQDQIIAKLKEIDSASRISAEQGTDIARQLRARKIMANELDTPMQRVFKLLQNAGVNPEQYTKEASTVDFNNPTEVVNFYRKLVPAKASDWLDQLRYNSMLSSPNTHINNAFSNLGNTAIVAPIEKTLTGTLDFLSSPFRGGKRNQFALEGPAYSAGYISSLGKAASKFADVMRGVKQSENLDTKYIPVATTGIKGVAAKTLDLPMRLLEASDQFFTTLTAGGEEAALKLRQSRGVDVGDIQGIAKDNAAYRLFRSELNDPKQGALLKGIDHLTGLIMKARNDKSWVGTVAKFTIPFVKTPMNILKQMVEYSPAGIATIPGAMNKTEQLSKAIMGTSAALGAAMLLGSGRTTWAEPTDAKKKAAFRAAGMQPYSVKIGDKWVSYSKLPPLLAANLALVSAVKDGIENKRLDDSAVDSILSGVSKWGNFFADQSYLKQMGDLVAAVKGDTEKITSYFSNYPQQLVPFRALSGWVARIIDPYQRKVNTDAGFLDKQMQQLMMNIPGLSQQVPARTDQNGAPIENQNRVFNAFSPVRVTTEKPQARSEYDSLVAKAKETRLENDLRDRVKGSKDVVQSGNKVAFMGSDGKTHVIDTSFQPTPPKLTGQKELDKKAISKFNGEITQKANDIYDLYKAGKITDQEAEKALNDLKSLKAKTGSGKLKKITFKKSVVKPIKITLPKARKIATMKLRKPPKAKLAKFKAKTALKITKIKPIQAKKLKGLSAGARLV